ncbi:MAG: DUF92 domain-containing protein [Rhodothermales bacterium]
MADLSLALPHPILVLPAAAAGGYLAYRLHLLTRSGALTATAFGLCLLAFGGAAWFWLAMAFFIPTSLLSRVGRARKADAEARVEKGSRRDAGQVLANGGVAWLMLGLYAVSPETAFLWGFVGAFSAAAADTWATELGGLARAEPRLITTGRRVPAGTSGGVTWGGSLGACAGAIWMGAAGGMLGLLPVLGVAAVGMGGVAGAFADSLLGATAQALYRDQRGNTTERPAAASERVRGWDWVTNDVVNVAATAVGAAVGAGLGLAWGGS